jgi:hypothetical protein
VPFEFDVSNWVKSPTLFVVLPVDVPPLGE